ncbi:MAG: protein phosphatase 2C domain-containing protein [Tannerella sp.]|jgi:protein phosphatase|nr:protein phosphatase 2C domain-containing protein [Tannerella sp.]
MNITLERPFAATEKGGRNNNEDFIYPLSELANSGGRFFMVCDGVGGAERGEVASALACDSFKTFFNTFFEGDDPSEEFINKAVLYTESRFDEYVKQHPEAKGMATTLTFLYVGVSGITIAHIGDSRIYHIRDGKIIYATEDHSLVNSWIQLGKLTKEEAAVHPQKNVITRAVMDSEHSVGADVKLITDIQPGDRFLMCTDGVTECFTDEKLENLFSQGQSAEAVKNTIVEHCTDEARDNFSFYILSVQNVQKTTGYRQYILSFFYSLI